MTFRDSNMYVVVVFAEFYLISPVLSAGVELQVMNAFYLCRLFDEADWCC